jgi:hypothetical protein
MLRRRTEKTCWSGGQMLWSIVELGDQLGQDIEPGGFALTGVPETLDRAGAT